MVFSLVEWLSSFIGFEHFFASFSFLHTKDGHKALGSTADLGDEHAARENKHSSSGGSPLYFDCSHVILWERVDAGSRKEKKTKPPTQKHKKLKKNKTKEVTTYSNSQRRSRRTQVFCRASFLQHSVPVFVFGLLSQVVVPPTPSVFFCFVSL